ncbi:RuvC-like resolvase [Arthrobacter phage Wollypog]|uniref:RuvC-like resolvase n=1 Tax=Arthrobacter phage Wollypog TaxID=2790985 RepID=A0A7T3KCL3_9CAUD|nr:RuvC-like resolvase [Arthrobacter phage Wollypog]QPX62624.1 RuvC-like resolvase [Arthrobacter phage Wollypog]
MKSVFAGSGAPPFLAALKRVEAALSRKYSRAGRLPEIGRVLSVDPGKITGVSVFWFWRSTGKPIAWAETLITHDEDRQVLDLMSFLDLLSSSGRVDVLVENFTVHSVKKDPSFLSPVRIGRAFRFAVLLVKWSGKYFHEVEVYMVEPSEMASMDDDRLKALGFFTPGPDHRRDATRHLLVHLKRVRQFLQNSRVKGVRLGGASVDLGYWRVANKGLWEPKVEQNSAVHGRVHVLLNGKSTRRKVRL